MTASWDRLTREALDQRPDLAGEITALRPLSLDTGGLVLAPIAGTDLPSARLAVAGALLATRAAGLLRRPLALAAVRSASQANAASAEAGERSRAWREAEAHPLVKDLIKRFDAEVIERTPSDRDRFLRTRGG